MDKKTIILFLICLIALFASFSYAISNNYQGYFIELPLTIAVIGFFISGILFFGFLAFIPHIFYGLTLGATKNASIIVYIFPISLATYAGIKLGNLLFNDFNREEYFIKSLKDVIILFIIAIILSIIIEFTLPQLISIWPSNLFGLEIVENKETITSMITNLANLTRN